MARKVRARGCPPLNGHRTLPLFLVAAGCFSNLWSCAPAAQTGAAQMVGGDRATAAQNGGLGPLFVVAENAHVAYSGTKPLVYSQGSSILRVFEPPRWGPAQPVSFANSSCSIKWVRGTPAGQTWLGAWGCTKFSGPPLEHIFTSSGDPWTIAAGLGPDMDSWYDGVWSWSNNRVLGIRVSSAEVGGGIADQFVSFGSLEDVTNLELPAPAFGVDAFAALTSGEVFLVGCGTGGADPAPPFRVPDNGSSATTLGCPTPLP